MPDQSSATRIELLGFDGSYFTLAGWTGSKTLEAKALLEARDVLRGFVRDPGNGISCTGSIGATCL